MLSKNTAIILLLALAILLPRVLDLNAFLAPDEKKWLANTSGFTTKLAHGEWDDLIQQPHPGITTQWLGAPTVFSNSWVVRKLPLVIAQSILVFMIGYIFYRLQGKWPAITLTLLLAINPQLIAHTRVYAMDSLLALFLLLSLVCLLLWRKTNTTRYLIYAAIAGALAFWSKLPGLLIIPFSITAIPFFTFQKNKKGIINYLKPIVLWCAAFLIASILILPSFAISPLGVIGSLTEFFRSDDYTSLHVSSKTYYLGTLAFFSTPLQLISLLALPFILILRPFKRSSKTLIATIVPLIFAALFVIMMSSGTKMGDRYILPVFLILDVFIVTTAWQLFQSTSKKVKNATLVIFILGITWQTTDIIKLHPHYLAYTNPITRPFLNNRRMGWGEGLDIAAQYLNQKPNAKDLTIATIYPTEFKHSFIGQTVPAHQHDHEQVDYVVLYRNMFERGPDAWQTDVLNQYKNTKPEKTIILGGIEYVWIYNRK